MESTISFTSLGSMAQSAQASDLAAESTTWAPGYENAKDFPLQQSTSKFEKWSVYIAVSFFFGGFVLGFASFSIESSRQKSANTYNVAFDPRCIDEVTDSAEDIFVLDLTFGNLTFVQAKVIDAAWDTIIGQGGRLLHGWIVYRYIIANLLIYAMEYSTITYDILFTLAFSKSSIMTLWKVLKMIFSTQNGLVALYTAALIYPLCYTLLFSVIWSTATGYISLSHKLFAMPNGDVIPLNSDKLSLCWALDSKRLGLPTNSVHIEIGPNFSMLGVEKQPLQRSRMCLQDSTAQPLYSPVYLQYTAAGWNRDDDVTVWNQFSMDPGLGIAETSENFRNIHAYSLTMQLLRISLNPREWLRNGINATIGSVISNETIRLDWWAKSTGGLGCAELGPNNSSSTVDSLQLVAPGQGDSIIDTLGTTAAIMPYNMNDFQKTYWSRFMYNESLKLDAGMVPYNSTIWLNKTAFQLPAPFLDLGYQCTGSSIFTSLGNCVCYNGTPIPLDLLSNDRVICNTASGYVWGFSSNLLVKGTAFEAAFLVTVCFCYLVLKSGSRMIEEEKQSHKTSGLIRLALDISESVRDDLGAEQSQLLQEQALESKLRGFKIGYDKTPGTSGRFRYRVKSGIVSRMRQEPLFAPGYKPTDAEAYEDLNWRIYNHNT